MATRIIHAMEEKQRNQQKLFTKPIKCSILIGGVGPRELHEAVSDSTNDVAFTKSIAMRLL